MKKQELIDAYQKMVANIEWHIKTNSPSGYDLEMSQKDLSRFSDFIQELESLDETPEQVEPVGDAVAFEEWLEYQGFDRRNEDGLWSNATPEDLFPMGDVTPPKYFTTPELYSLFLSQSPTGKQEGQEGLPVELYNKLVNEYNKLKEQDTDRNLSGYEDAIWDLSCILKDDYDIKVPRVATAKQLLTPTDNQLNTDKK